MIGNENLYSWIFHYSPYINKWRAVKREHYNDLFSNIESSNIMSSSRIETLIEIIYKTDGEEEGIKTLLKNNK